MADPKITLTAVDQTKAAFASVAQNLDGLRAKAAAFTGALAALPVAGFAAGLATSIKNAIDVADGLDDLSQKVGISVERLSELKFLLDVEGVSTDQLQQGIKALSDALVKANDATSKEAQLLKILGVTARDPYQALRQLADAFAALPDGAVQTTVASDLLGKAALALIPALNGGSKAIDAAAASARKLGLVLSEETAAKAAEFNDNMKKLSLSAGAVGIALSGRLVGGLSEFTSGMVKAKEEGRVLNQIMNDMLGTFLELHSELPVVGGLFAALRDRNAQRIAEDRANNAARSASGWIRGGFTGPAPPPDLEERVRKLLAAQNMQGAAGPKQLSVEEIIANSRLLLLRRADEEEEEGNREAAQADSERLQIALESAQERARIEDEQIAKLAEVAQRNREIGQTYIDLIDPVAKYRKQLEEINKLEQLAVSEGGLSGEQAEIAREKVAENIRKLSTEATKAKSVADELGLTFTSAFERAILSGEKLRDVLKGVVKDIAGIIIRRQVTEPAVKAISKLLNFADGGSFQVGGSGGTDSQLVAFNASPNERVTIETPEQQRSGRGGVVNNYFTIDAKGADAGVAQRIEAAVRQAVSMSLQAVQAQSDRGGSFARAVGRR